ncbi:MAG: galactose-1-phosphate uridylyltransferase [Geothermobacteraceae bacterium]
MSEFRWDPLRDCWVIIDPERGRQPQEFLITTSTGKSEEECPFCPGREDRTPGQIDALAPPGQDNWQVRVIPNRFPVLKVEGNLDPAGNGLYDRLNGIGAHEIVIEHRQCGLDFDNFEPGEIQLVLHAWQRRLLDLRGDRRLRHITVIRNHGPGSGSRLSHPHSQIVALPMIPPSVARELRQAREHFQRKQRCLLCDLLSQERQQKSGILLDRDGFIVFAPWASARPFSLRILPERHRHDFCLVDGQELAGLAAVLQELVSRLNHALRKPSYRLVLRSAPPEQHRPGQPDLFTSLPYDWHWYLELSPCLARDTGIEQATGIAVNPVAPEDAAAFLRTVDLS